MKLNKRSLITAALIVAVLSVVGTIIGLPAWVPVVASVVLLVVLAVVWKQEEANPAVEQPLPHLQVVTALHRKAQTSSLERQLEQEKRAYLRDDVLATPGSAAVSWLANNPGEVAKCVDLLGTLTRLSAVANDLPVEALEDGRADDNGHAQLMLSE